MSQGYAFLLLSTITMQNVFHAFSAWIIVVIALFRLLYIKTGINAVFHCSIARAWFAIMLVCLASLVLTVPFMLAHQVTEITRPTHNIIVSTESNLVLYEVDYSKNAMLRSVLFWNSAVLIKALPILIMSGVSAMLINSIRQTEKRYRSLQCDTNEARYLRATSTSGIQQTIAGAPPSNGNTESVAMIEASKLRSALRASIVTAPSGRNANQTTYMLLMIIILYIFTYLPQSAMLLLNHFLGRCFSRNVYEKLGDFSDFLTLLNNSINFILYCGMSKQFRDTFVSLFCSRFL
ncbi:hypothetical protein EG68_01661 [Paragonimus skrjabini miyazakii]|uniref:G-protein coupled receptors family 1 profile domain-containing protein n=1 Tax=Paragonimus skrjabini miyazakii TaxID=59628 RepID=A0A8S9Z5X7_9TREM|nr:hypothetical protein EG68_01661 [Paragonimus skrjabini miyazakii]